jgi:uroporphyrinogen-III decarboxylase
MERSFYLDMAARGMRLPVATHLVLHENPDPEAILLDGKRLAAVMSDTARRFDSPLALPVMDLTLEKDIMLRTMGIPAVDVAGFHFEGLPDAKAAAAIVPSMDVLKSPRIKANYDAIATIAREGELLPVGMSIGPFSLLTKFLKDPIVPIYLAGQGLGPEDSEEVAALASILKLCETVIHASIRAQIAAGAKAMFVCEPAANLVFFSPNQLREGSTVFDDFVIAPNLRVKALLEESGVDLIFHDCGELIPEMVKAFAVLDPAIISLGSPVKLWEVEPYIPMTTVILGNLPTKKFYSDTDVPLDGVPGMVRAIDEKMGESGHPYIVGSECDILSMPGYEKAIMKKVEAFVSTACACYAR